MARLKDPATLRCVSVRVQGKTRLEHLLQPHTPETRLAVVGALYLAQTMKDEFTRRYGTKGWEALERLLSNEQVLSC